MGDSQVQAVNRKYKPGTLKFLKLTNFMCHESFELSFGPSVNFIIGPNGSGKSALLTAIVVVLGARATTTARAKKVNELIMYGKDKCKIQLILHNYDTVMDCAQAYKPDDYGKQIIIEKSMFKDGLSKLALKNSRGQKISERKSELDDMLDFFGILINNPICILNQEISKTFLHSKRPEDKFELFMRATNLEQIESNYASAKDSLTEWGEINNRNKIGFRRLDNEYATCKEKTKFLQNRANLTKKEQQLNTELVWSIIKENERYSEEHTIKKRIIQSEIATAEEEIESRNDKIKHCDEEIEVTKLKIQSTKEQIKECDKKLSEHRSKETEIKKRRIEIRLRLDRANNDITKLSRSKAQIEKSIADIKKQLDAQDSLNLDNERRKLEIERLESELANEKARHKSLSLNTSHLSASMTATRTELLKANLRVSELRNSISAQEASLRRLKNGLQDGLRRYGDNIVQVLAEIENAYKSGRFKEKPIGPLGHYIRLTLPDVAPSLEVQLGRNAHAFACDNHSDMTVLISIFRKCYGRMRQPLIITRPFGRKHDANRFRAHHSQYKTMLDYLEIERDEVFNALLDRANLESILYIPSYKEAENLMINPALIPRNTRSAFTKDASCMYPRTASGGYKCIANPNARGELFTEGNASEIKSRETEIAMLNADLNDALNIARDLDANNKAQRREYDLNQTETNNIMKNIRSMEVQLLELKTTVVNQPQELSGLEEELETNSRQIAELRLAAEGEKELLEEVEKELKDSSHDKESSMQILEKFETELRNCTQIIEKLCQEKQLWKDKIAALKVSIETKKKELDIKDEQLNILIAKVARCRASLTEEMSEPETVRETSIIQDELKKLEAQIRAEQEEERDPEEVLKILAERMKEIKEMQTRKDFNNRNFDLSAKELRLREDGFVALREYTVHSVGLTFNAVMRTMKMNGELNIYLDDVIEHGEVIHKKHTLEMKIETNYTPATQRVPGATSVMSDTNNNTSSSSRRVSSSQPATSGQPSRAKRPRVAGAGGDEPATEKENGHSRMSDSRSLSGGERSFSTVAFVLSLWHHCPSPFKLMDEIDVFMDMVTRRVSYNALIRYAQARDEPGQFLFFSPLELPKFEDTGAQVRVFEMPAIIRKRSQMPASSENTDLGSAPAPNAGTPRTRAAPAADPSITPARIRRRI